MDERTPPPPPPPEAPPSLPSAAARGAAKGTAELRAEQRRLLRASLLSGLCPLFPVPIVDDWLADGIRERAIADLLRGRGLRLDPAEIRLLARGEEPPGAVGCAGCATTAIVWPARLLFRIVIKGLLRKLIFVLAIKDCASELSRSYHLGHLLRHAAAIGAFDGPPAERPARLLQIRRAVEKALAGMGLTPLDPWIRIAFRRSWRLVVQTAAGMSDFLRRRPRPAEKDAVIEELEQETRELDPLVDELEAELAGKKDYLRGMEIAFENALRT
jgi:hypothetical protein